MRDLAGRAAFVTGGASGIGLGVAAALVAEGVRVAIADIDEEQLGAAAAHLREAGGESFACTLDVRDREQWQTARAAAETALGPVSILCNNAGVTGYDRIVDTPPEHWDWILGVNLTGTFNGIHTFARAMIDRGDGGHVVNTASIAGLYGSRNLTVGAYAASKFGVVGLSERLRAELAPDGIGVSILCPGLVSTRIGANAQQLRPGPPGVELVDNPVFAGLRKGTPVAGLSPQTCGRSVVAAIKENRAYVITHPHFRSLVEARHEAILADFGDPADPDLPIPGNWRDLA
jgi:NAD(P)-dependent dehydrogenase (short-subunit alcohol dehydrogenase family)